MKKLMPVLLLLLAACHKAPTVLPTEVTPFRNTGLDVSWDQSGSNRIAYSIKEAFDSKFKIRNLKSIQYFHQ